MKEMISRTPRNYEYGIILMTIIFQVKDEVTIQSFNFVTIWFSINDSAYK